MIWRKLVNDYVIPFLGGTISDSLILLIGFNGKLLTVIKNKSGSEDGQKVSIEMLSIVNLKQL